MIKNIVIDLDGCLTDGGQNIAVHGSKLFKRVHARDKQTIRRLILKGYRVIVVSADDWVGGRLWVESTGAEFIHIREKHLMDIDWSQTLGVADDLEDSLFLAKCAMAFCPKDADARLTVRRLKVRGGQAIMEHIEQELSLVVDNHQKPPSNAVPVGGEPFSQN